MKKLEKKIFRCLLIGFLQIAAGELFISALSYAESLTLQTTYPAPVGHYNRIKIIPKTSPTYVPPNCYTNGPEMGSIYMNSSGALQICSNDGLGNIGWLETLNLWTKSVIPETYHTRSLNPQLKVGVALASPQAALHIGGNEAVILIRPNQSNSFIELDPTRLRNDARISIVTRAYISYIEMVQTYSSINRTARIWYDYSPANGQQRGLYLQSNYSLGNLPNIFITEFGNVGMGAVSSNSPPTQKLDVYVKLNVLGDGGGAGNNPGRGKVLTAIDNEGTTTWEYPGFAP